MYSDFRYHNLQSEHPGPMTPYLQEIIYSHEDTRGMREYGIKESWKPASSFGFIQIGNLLHADDGQRIEPLGEGPPLTIVNHMGDISDAYPFDRHRDAANGRPRLFTGDLSRVTGDTQRYQRNNPIVVGIAKNMDLERKRAMMTALDILNIFQERYNFTSVIMDYRDRGYHHIRFRKNLLMLENEILETRVPDDEQGLILTYNDWDYAESFSHEMKTLFLLHELIVGVKSAQGEQWRSVIDISCDANNELQEDSSYLPGRSRVLTLCHMESIYNRFESLISQ